MADLPPPPWQPDMPSTAAIHSLAVRGRLSLFQGDEIAGDYLLQRSRHEKDFERKFEQYGTDSVFLSLPASEWQQCSAYLAAKEVVANLPCINDTAERVLGLAREI